MVVWEGKLLTQQTDKVICDSFQLMSILDPSQLPLRGNFGSSIMPMEWIKLDSYRKRLAEVDGAYVVFTCATPANQKLSGLVMSVLKHASDVVPSAGFSLQVTSFDLAVLHMYFDH